MGGQDQPQLALLDLRQHQRAERQVVRIHVFLGCERNRAWLCVGAFDKPDGRFQRQQARDILDRPVEVGLQGDARARVIRAQPAIEIQRRLRISAAFHVDP